MIESSRTSFDISWGAVMAMEGSRHLRLLACALVAVLPVGQAEGQIGFAMTVVPSTNSVYGAKAHNPSNLVVAGAVGLAVESDVGLLGIASGQRLDGEARVLAASAVRFVPHGGDSVTRVAPASSGIDPVAGADVSGLSVGAAWTTADSLVSAAETEPSEVRSGYFLSF
jgi:hypothetical protein